MNIDRYKLSRYIVGTFYGYPECCKLDFANRPLFGKLTIEQEAVHNFKGFVPCPSCATKVYNGEIKIEELIKDRKCSQEYPNDHTEGEMDEYFENEMKLMPMDKIK